jgi:hypothetical protein
VSAGLSEGKQAETMGPPRLTKDTGKVRINSWPERRGWERRNELTSPQPFLVHPLRPPGRRRPARIALYLYHIVHLFCL